jgi:DNA-binding FadR family transcriptional regulator
MRSAVNGAARLDDRIDQARRTKISVAIAKSIVRHIADRHLQPGSPLLPEQAMAAQYGVGRASVREALRLLEMHGLVDIRRGNGGGPLVGSSSAERFGETMTMHLQPLGATLRDLNALAIDMQGLLAERAAQMVKDRTADPAKVAEMVEWSHREIAGESTSDLVTDGHAFHRCIAEIVDSPTLGLISSALGHVYSQRTGSGDPSMFDEKVRLQFQHDHVKIGAAIARGNAAHARKLMLEHMMASNAALEKAQPGLTDNLVYWD